MGPRRPQLDGRFARPVAARGGPWAHGGDGTRCLEVLRLITGFQMIAATHSRHTKAGTAHLKHGDRCQRALTPSTAATGPAKRPSSWPPRPRLTIKTGSNTHHSPNHWSYCSSMIILARPDATVAMWWPTVHEKTSHGSPTEPTGRPSNGVGWAPIGPKVITVSL